MYRQKTRPTRDQFDRFIVESNDEGLITNALRVAAEQFDADAEEFAKVAAYIRAGNNYPMFAPGEAGAVAADRLEAQFKRQRDESLNLLARINGDDEDEEDS